MRFARRYFTAALLLALTFAMIYGAKQFDELFFMVYPGLSGALLDFLSSLSSHVLSPVWQAGVYVLLVCFAASVVVMILRKQNFFLWLGSWLIVVCAGVFLFVGMWGLNYYAPPLAQTIHLETEGQQQQDLIDAANYYVMMSNALADKVTRDADGVADFSAFDVLAQQASNGYNTLKHTYSIFSGSEAPVKALRWAGLFSRFGITGITVPFTGEACVNPQTFEAAIPFTMCHELAHRMSIASEDEANFAAFLACSANDSLEFQYSGYYMAYIYCYNALYETDRDAALAVKESLSPGMAADVEATSTYYSQFKGKMHDAAQEVNDAYLKAMGQEDGVDSYGEVAKLLVAWYLREVAGTETAE